MRRWKFGNRGSLLADLLIFRRRWKSKFLELWRSEILSYLQVNKLACWNFFAGKRQETLGSETKDFSTHSSSSAQNINIFLYLSLEPRFQRLTEGRTKWHLHIQCVVLLEWNSEFRKLKSFIIDSKHALFFLGRDISVFQGCLLYRHLWKASSEQSQKTRSHRFLL